MSVIHSDKAQSWPDASGGIPCCMGYAAGGPGFCTCWEPVVDLKQQPFNGDETIPTAEVPCHDCAYRKGSPERAGADGYSGDEDTLFHIAATGKAVFFCHQGVPRTLKWRHPSGMEIEAHPASYQYSFAIVNGERLPLKADGSIASLCGGYCAKRKAFTEAREKNLTVAKEGERA